MKALLKQKFFLLGILLIAAAVAVGVLNGNMHKKMSVVSTMEKGLQKQSIRTLKKVVPPSEREKDYSLDEELQSVLALYRGFGIDLKQYHILQGNVIKDEEGNVIGVNTIQVYEQNDVMDISVNRLELTKENGKYYISGGLY